MKMKTNNSRIGLVNIIKLKSKYFNLLIISAFLCFSACSNDNKQAGQPVNDVAKLKVFCEDGLYNLSINPINEFDTLNRKVDVHLIRASTFDCFAKLLATEADIIISGRDYTPREDSLMKAYHVEKHYRQAMAYDALVFYVPYQVNIDTLNADQIREVLTKKDAKYQSINSKIPFEPIFAVPYYLSSEYYNLQKYATKGKEIKKSLKQFSTSDSVMRYVETTPHTIGIGYMSYVMKNPKLKMICIGYKDSVGNAIFPHAVQQANLALKLYPYIIPLYVYMLDKKADASLAFIRFMTKAGNSQRYFNNAGICPAFGQIKLTE
jgi:ABC-type phosphate transport system substrate-binding protein